MNQQPNEQRPPQERRRWELLLIPLAALVLLALWTRPVSAPPGWSLLLDEWPIRDRLRFTDLAMFAMCLIAIIAIARARRSP
jgi:hypothetical protein